MGNGSLAKPLVLVVEDEAALATMLRYNLERQGFRVDEATDGTEALAKLRAGRFSLVISDWNMEPMTGIELLKEVRAQPSTAKMLFIMVTAESKTENVIAAKQAGASQYIVKPFTAETLKAKISSVLV